MKIKRIVSSVFIVFISIIIALISGCKFVVEHDKKIVLNAYTSENAYEKYYTFKAKVKSIRNLQNPDYENEKYFSFDVDYEYFEQLYGDDEYATLDGRKRWEVSYTYFNSFEFMIIPSNYRILAENGGYDLLQEGIEVIISANSYYAWSGWEYPILSLTIDETTYLNFETGLENYINYVKAGFKDS